MNSRDFILRHTRPVAVPDTAGITLNLAENIVDLWEALQSACDNPSAPLPFWAAAWVGGRAVARYLLERPGEVRGRRVLDFASGSGICALVAAGCGASEVVAVDVDPIACEAIRLNAETNARSLQVVCRDLLDRAPPSADVILVGDACYEAPLAARVVPWLRDAHVQGTRVLIGDPHRAYLPAAALSLLREYELATSLDLEDVSLKLTGVYTLLG